VLARCPKPGRTPSLDHPSLTATTPIMGEMPADLHVKPSSARWAIPLALVAIVAIAVVYEFGRPLAEHGKAGTPDRNAAQRVRHPSRRAEGGAPHPRPAKRALAIRVRRPRRRSRRGKRPR
jgi:hypothetical protein